MQPSHPAQTLHAAITTGGTIPRPLVAPLASAIAGTLQGMEPMEFLRDTTKLSNGVRDLTRSLNTDAAIAEFGTFWDAEAMGLSLDWSNGMPEPEGVLAAASTGFMEEERAPVVVETVRRLAGLVGGKSLVAASVTGPATLSHLSDGNLSVTDALGSVLEAVRGLCEAGTKAIFVRETGPPDDLDELAWEMEPVWSSISFYQASGLLHLTGEVDVWGPYVTGGRPFLTCFDPAASSILTEHFSESGLFGLALPPGEPSDVAGRLLATGRCALLTNDAELYGRVEARELKGTVAALRSVAKG